MNLRCSVLLGVALFQTKASPDVYIFYKKLGYVEILFHSLGGEPDGWAMEKYL